MTARCRWPLVLAVVLASAACTGPPEPDPESPAASYVRTGEWGEADSALLEACFGCRTAA